MTDHVARLNLIAQSLRDYLAALPTPAANRTVTRSWQPLGNVADAIIKEGQYTLISVSEGGYPNVNGGEAQDGRLKLLLIGRIKLPEDATGEAIEDAEWGMFDNEVAPWLRDLPQELCCLIVTNFITSGQVQAPYGACVFELEECLP